MKPKFLLRALAVIACLFAASAVSAPAQGVQEVVVDQGVIAPTPIAIMISSATDASGNNLGQQISKVVSADLDRSGYFKLIDPNAFIQTHLDANVQPNWVDWRTINAQDLGVGQARVDADGRLTVDLHLYDVFAEDELNLGHGTSAAGVEYTATPDNWRRVAHKIADAIYEKLTGQSGYFDTRIAFVAESGSHGKRVKRLEIMDQDGGGLSGYLTSADTKVMTPRFSPDSKEVAYMALSADSARIYILNVENGNREVVGEVKGMAFAPRFSPDGAKLAFSVIQGANTDIYVIDLRTRAMTRLTRDPAIDTSPSFSADGSKIAFTSDRGGSPQIYIMNADGSGVHRLTFGGGQYSTPVFSPKGDQIAFTKQSEGRFSIGVMNADGTGEKLLTSSYLEEGPTWAPNGRYIMFFREPQGGLPSLWMVEASGRIERPVPYTGGGASDPAWSALLN